MVREVSRAMIQFVFEGWRAISTIVFRFGKGCMVVGFGRANTCSECRRPSENRRISRAKAKPTNWMAGR